MNVVVYYRARPLEPGFSDQALKEQRDAVLRWLTKNPTTVIAEYVEAETTGTSRPRLAEAIRACKSAAARLLIARTEPIGGGSLFEPRIRSVAVAIAPKTKREIGHVVPNPKDALPGCSLYFPDYRAMRGVPVYLCNNAGDQIENLQIAIVAITSKIESSPEVGSLTKELATATDDTSNSFPNLPAFSSVLVDHYEPMTDGDEIVSYAIMFTAPGGERRQMTALIGPGGLTGRFAKLDEAHTG